MAHTLVSNHVHLVFSTKNRERILSKSIRDRLWRIMHAIMKQHGIGAVVIGGHDDHCHALLSIPPTITISDAAKLLKGASSRWLSKEYRELPGFSWQIGYSAFSVSYSLVPKVIAYINGQEEHHRRIDYTAEINLLLRKHEIEATNTDDRDRGSGSCTTG